jgi:hypothetical protein
MVTNQIPFECNVIFLGEMENFLENFHIVLLQHRNSGLNLKSVYYSLFENVINLFCEHDCDQKFDDHNNKKL